MQPQAAEQALLRLRRPATNHNPVMSHPHGSWQACRECSCSHGALGNKPPLSREGWAAPKASSTLCMHHWPLLAAASAQYMQPLKQAQRLCWAHPPNLYITVTPPQLYTSPPCWTFHLPGQTHLHNPAAPKQPCPTHRTQKMVALTPTPSVTLPLWSQAAHPIPASAHPAQLQHRQFSLYTRVAPARPRALTSHQHCYRKPASKMLPRH